ncbi:aminotransferase class IV family protein [Tranquillimonas alkanivorans]|uniref:Probable branched-chain-amino-acid aminotransferase n=1 Tax=Tranquillimonas alkanivorans TaxID=441119 RepID=A0A1I5M394_9RHOB|nr:aminotransferase class IV family protein [Tranquillimonas alkanivorans]SFP04074.1 4-amino-4-deoxychorismate lyase [Tranquillimonas alkanivorans]
MEKPFRRPLPPGLKLIETLRRDPGTPPARLERHLDRLEQSAARLGFPCDRDTARARLLECEGDLPLRLRLTLGADGTLEVTQAPLGEVPSLWHVRLAEMRLRSDDPWLGVKSTQRVLYTATRAALPAGVDEVLFLNERGEVVEGTITNVFLDRDGTLLTPPLSSGALPGVLRRTLLDEGRALEAVLHAPDLEHGQLFVGNSVRGLVPARLG